VNCLRVNSKDEMRVEAELMELQNKRGHGILSVRLKMESAALVSRLDGRPGIAEAAREFSGRTV
jgi:hypothetical protein